MNYFSVLLKALEIAEASPPLVWLLLPEAEVGRGQAGQLTIALEHVVRIIMII